MSASAPRRALPATVTLRPTDGVPAAARLTVPAAPATLTPAASPTAIALIALAAPLAPSFDEPRAAEGDDAAPESGIWTVRPPRAEHAAPAATYWLRDLRPRG